MGVGSGGRSGRGGGGGGVRVGVDEERSYSKIIGGGEVVRLGVRVDVNEEVKFL